MGRMIPVLILLLSCALSACGPDARQPGPFDVVEEAVWREVNSSAQGADGIFVQAELRTFAYEIASAYARAARHGLSQEQLEYRLRQLIHSYIDGTYPIADGTDINNLFFQYLVYVNPDFDQHNPLHQQHFENWRHEFASRVIDRIYEGRQPVLRNHYDERWGLELFSRLVFVVYLKNESANSPPSISDIGTRTFLVDAEGNRYQPSGNHGPYLYRSDRPATDVLHDEAVYRVVFPNRKPDRSTPIVTPDTPMIALEIHGLGQEDVRRMEWTLPFDLPELPQRRLRSEHDEDTPDRGEAQGTRGLRFGD